METQIYFDEYSNEEIRISAHMFIEYLSFSNGHLFDINTYSSLVEVKEYLDNFLEEAFVIEEEMV